MPINPNLAKDFVMELQVFVFKTIKDKFGKTFHYEVEELLDVSNEITEYAFGLMIRTHSERQLRFKFDDDIPF